MNFIDWVGIIGVSSILLAYFLNIKKILTNNDITYLMLNFIGATLACIASILLDYIPFVILEGVWAFVSLFELFKRIREKRN